MKKVFVWILLILWFLCLFHPAKADTEEVELIEMYVTASRLNGRAKPLKKSSIEALFDKGDSVEAIGWSKNHHWIEVKGGEPGTVWVWWEYLTERTDEFTVINDGSTKLKIRKEPYGTVTGYLKPGKELIIDQVIFGWGHSNKGWIELIYTMEED